MAGLLALIMRMNKHTNQGFTLLEVLVALLVLMVGMLGLAGLQTVALSTNHGSYLRSQAIIQAHDMADRMHANPVGVQAGAYNSISGLGTSPPPCLTTATGGDALAAAGKGAEVTGVDLSARMIELASARFANAGLKADLRQSDLRSFDPGLPYDAVVANFLVDCFDVIERPRVVNRLNGFLRPGGTVLISDTGSPRGSRLGRACWYAYHGVAYSVTWAQGLTTWLPVMDLRKYLLGSGFTVEEQVFHRPRPRGARMSAHA